MVIDDLVRLLIVLFQEIDSACKGLQFCKENGGILYSRLQLLQPEVAALQRNPKLGASHKIQKGLENLQVHLYSALKIFQQCGKGSLYCFFNHRRLEQGIVLVNHHISHALIDLSFVSGKVLDQFRDEESLEVLGASRELENLSLNVDGSNAKALVVRLQQTHNVSAADVATLKEDVADLEKKNRELQARLELGSLSKEAAEDAFMKQVVALLSHQDAQGLPGPSEPDEREVPPEFICPISKEVMGDPVIVFRTGQTFERLAISNWFNDGHRTCPVSSQPLETIELTPNISLRNQIQSWAQRVGYTLPVPNPNPNPPPSQDVRSPSLASLPSFGSRSTRSLGGESNFSRQESGISVSAIPLQPRLRPESTFEGLQTLAMDGDPLAQFELGMCYSIPSRGAPFDEAKGVKCFKRAADAGLPQALGALAECHFYGKGTEVNQAEGVRCASLVAHLDEPIPILIMAMAHAEGLEGMEKDPERAAKLATDAKKELKRWAREVGDPLYQAALGLLYLNGNDEGQAVFWMEQAARKGATLANAFMGDYWSKQMDKPGGHKGPTEKAYDFYKKAAEKGYPPAQTVVGNWCLVGKRGMVRQNLAEATEWFRKAALSGFAPAQLAYGKCLTVPAEAVKWYEKAAEQGLADAQFHLSECYGKGRGVEADRDKARELLLKAARQKHEKAKAVLDAQAKALADFEKQVQARKRWTKAFDRLFGTGQVANKPSS